MAETSTLASTISPEALARYAVLIQVYQAGGLSLPDDFKLASLEPQVEALLGNAIAQQEVDSDIRVSHIIANHKAKYYSRERNQSDTARMEKLCGDLRDFAGNLEAAKFGPVKLAEFSRLPSQYWNKSQVREPFDQSSHLHVPQRALPLSWSATLPPRHFAHSIRYGLAKGEKQLSESRPISWMFAKRLNT